MKKLEELWQKLTVPQRIALAVLGDVLTYRDSIVNLYGANINSRMLLDSIPQGMDSTVLREVTGSFLGKFIDENDISDFDELYKKLMTLI